MEPQTFDEYWLSYLSGHAKPLTRALHYFGLFFGQLIGIAVSFYVAWWAFFIIGPVSYIIAFASHEHVEGNSNKPFALRPAWSVISFFRMLLLDLTGNLNKELSRLT
ncbi:Mpo1-like protein [Pseudomonas leptonychotis]|uniref:Mpo1-like protein n=1 Tax=Pseudomonas leptonychotis TaxID=2448482 RepID=UPI0039F1451E